MSRKFPYDFRVLRVFFDHQFRICHFEVAEIKSRRNGASDQGKGIGLNQAGSEPIPSLYEGLEEFTPVRVAAEHQLMVLSDLVDDVDGKR